MLPIKKEETDQVTDKKKDWLLYN